MEVETRERGSQTVIDIESESEVVVVVKSGGKERIYLPGVAGDDSTYYAETGSSMMKTDTGFRVIHPGPVHELDIIS